MNRVPLFPVRIQRLALILIAAVAANGLFKAGAQSTWSSAQNGNWSNGANWNSAPTSGSTTELDFTASGAAYTATDDFTVFTLNKLVIGGNAAVTLSGSNGNTLTFANSSGTSPDIVDNSTSSQTIINNNIAIGSGVNLLFSGTGNQNITIGGGITGAGSITVSGSANGPTFVFGGGAGVTFSGGFTLTSGNVAITNSSSGTPVTGGPVGTGTLTLNGGLIRSSSGSNRSLGNNVLIGGNVIFGLGGGQTGTLILTGTTAIGGSNATQTLTMNGNNAAATPVELGGPIGDGGNNNGLAITGTGIAQLGQGSSDTSANTYTGLTTVNGASATLLLDKAAGTNAIAGPITLSAGTLEFAQSNQILTSATLALNGGIICPATAFSGTLSNVNQIGGNVQFGNSTGGQVILTGTTTLAGSGATWTLNVGGTSTSATPVILAGPIVDGGNGNGLTITGTGILQLGGGSSDTKANTYTGTTTVNSGNATLLLDKAAGTNAIAGPITVSAGTLEFAQASQIATSSTLTLAAGTLDLHGNNETVGVFINNVVNTGGGGTVTSSTTGAITFTYGANDGNNDFFNGSINNGSGTVALVKQGNDTSILSGSNSFSGGYTLNAGQLVINGAYAPGTGTITLDGGTLRSASAFIGTFSNAIQIGGSVGLGSGTPSTGQLTLTGTTTLAGSGQTWTLTIGGTGSNVTPVILAGPIVDGGSNNGLTIVGTGILQTGSGSTDTKANTYTGLTTVNSATAILLLDKAAGTNAIAGPITVSSGTLQFAQANQIALSSSVTVFSTGVLDLHGTNQTVGLFTNNNAGGGTVTSSTTGAVTFTYGGNDGNIDYFGGSITNGSGTVAVVKQGSDESVLNGSSTFSGGLTLNAGQLVIGSSGALGTGTLALNGGLFRSTNGFSGTFSNPIQIGGGVELGFNTPSQLTLTGTTTLAGSGANWTLTISGAASNVAPVILAGPIVDGGSNNGLTIVGTGILQTGSGSTDTKANTYTGTTTVNSATVTLLLDKAAGTNAIAGPLTVSLGTVELAQANQIVTSATLTLASGGTLDLHGNNQTVGVFTGVGGTVTSSTTGAVTFTYGANDGNTDTFSGNISNGSGTVALVKQGSDFSVLSGSNSFGGGTQIDAGTLEFSSTSSMPSTGTVTGSSGATLAVAIGGAGQFTTGTTGAGSIGGLLGGTGGQGAPVTWTSGMSLGIDTTAASGTYAGTIVNPGGNALGLTLLGANMLTLTASNGYTGGTTLNSGTLSYGNLKALGSGTITFAGNSTLLPGVSGTVTNNVVINSGVTGTINVSNTNATFSGNISGSGALAGAGGNNTLTLSGSNSYTGGTLLTGAGNIDLGANGALGNGPLTLGNASTSGNVRLELNGYSQTITGFSIGTPFASVIQNQGGGAGVLTVALASGTDASTSNFYFRDSSTGLGGTLALVKTGAGTLNFSTYAGMSYSGGLTVNGGTLAFNNAAALGSGTIALGGGNLAVTSGSSVTISQPTTLTAATTSGINTGTGTVTYFGIISGPGALTKYGTGTLMLAGASTYTGTTSINGGVLALAVAGALSPTTQITFGGGTLQYIGDTTDYSAQIVNSGSAVSIDTGNQGVEFYNPLAASNTGGLVVMSSSGNGTLTLDGTQLYGGPTTIASGSLIVGDGLSGEDGSLNNSTRIIDNGTLTFNPFATGTNTVAVSGSGTVGMNGSGKEVLSSSNSYSGGTTLNAGTLNYGNVYALGSGTVTFTGNSTLQAGVSGTVADNVAINPGVVGNFDTQGYTVTLSGMINGSGALAKFGSGTLALSNSDSYSGNLAVNAGTLDMDGHSITVGALSGSSGAVITTTAGGTITLTSSSAGNGTYAGVIQNGAGTIGLTQAGTGTLTLTSSNGYSGGTTINAGTLNYGNVNALGSGTITFSGNSTLLAGVSGTVANNVVINPGVTGTINVSNTNATFSGNISGSGALVRAGGGNTLTLSGSNSYTGGTVLTGAGNLDLGANGALGNGTLTLGDVNTNFTVRLELNGYSQTVTGLSILNNPSIPCVIQNQGGGAGVLTVALASGTDSSTSNFYLRDNASGTGTLALVKTGAGTLDFSTYNTMAYSGGLTVNGGTLAFNNVAALGTGSITLGGGTLAVTSGSSVTISQAMTLTAATTSGINTGNGAVTYSGNLAGSGALAMYGAGTLTLSNSDSYSGGTTLNGGTLNFGNVNALGSGTATFSGNSSLQAGVAGTVPNNFVINPGVTGTFDTEINAVTLSGAITGSGALAKINSGALTLTASNGYSGGTTINAGTLNYGNVYALGSGAVTFSGNSTLQAGVSGTVANNAVINPGVTGSINLSNTNATFSGNISGSGALARTGAGNYTLTLSGSNSYTGGTLITGAGNLDLGANGALGNGMLTLGDVTANNSVRLELNGYSQTITGLSIGTASVPTVIQNQGGGAGVLTVALASGTDASTSNFYFRDNSNGSGGTLALIKTGAGTLDFSTYNTMAYSGGLTVNGGTLAFNNAAALGAGTITLGGGTLAVTSGASVNISQPTTLTAATTSGINTGSGAVTYSGTLSGSGALAVYGAGTLTLAGNNTYNGATTVNAGTLIVSGSLSGTGSASVAAGGIIEVDGLLNHSATTTLNGGTLQGTGSVGVITDNGGSTIAPGLTGSNSQTATGALTAAGSVTLAATTNFNIRLGLSASGTDSDQLTATGGSNVVSLNGASLRLTLGTAVNNPALIDTYYLIINGGANGTGVGGDIFAGLTQGSSFVSNGLTFAIDYATNYVNSSTVNSIGTGNDVVLELTAIPEPGTYGTVLLGIVGLGLWRRSRRI